MSMSRRELDSILGKMVEQIGADRVLMELTWVMDTDELEEYLGYISRVNELGLIGEEVE